jgi:transglutaminase/protease-like cytokinesis protein 3
MFSEQMYRQVALTGNLKNKEYQNTHKIPSTLCLSIDDEILGGSRWLLHFLRRLVCWVRDLGGVA